MLQRRDHRLLTAHHPLDLGVEGLGECVHQVDFRTVRCGLTELGPGRVGGDADAELGAGDPSQGVVGIGGNRHPAAHGERERADADGLEQPDDPPAHTPQIIDRVKVDSGAATVGGLSEGDDFNSRGK